MLAEKYFPKGSSRYQSLGRLFQRLDRFGALKPGRWFAIWTMVLAGANVTAHISNRWIYWDWSSFSILLLVVMAIAIWWDQFMVRFPIFPQTVTDVKTGLFTLIVGFILFTLGTIPAGFDHLVFAYGLPYFTYFLIGHLTCGNPIDQENKSVPSKREMAPILGAIIGLTFLTAAAGFMNDDPMIATIAAVYSPFPTVALTFPAAIRHIQRARIHVVFIPAMFIAIRFPWFLFMVLPLFWLLRYYHYFVHGEVKPCFKVDLPHELTD